ncbi:hypothetical protein Bca4012_021337 [Brassica carinata]
MEPTSLVDDAEFRLPPEFLTDDDFLVEKVFKGDESNLFPYKPNHGFGLDPGFGSTVKPTGDEKSFLTGLTRKTVRSTHEDDFSGGFCGNHAFPACGATRSRAGIGCDRRNRNYQTRVSSQAAAWDLYSAALEELAMMNMNDGYNGGRGVFDLPSKHPIAAAAAKNPNDGTGYYSRQSLQYQKLQVLQFQQLKQQQLMKLLVQQQSRGLKANSKKIAGHVDLSRSAWSNQPQSRDGSGMRAVFLGGGRTGKPRSTGTGVFLPRSVNHTLETREKPSKCVVETEEQQWRILEPDEDGANSE